MKKKNFTMIELMFVIAILVILMGISWVAGTTVLRAQAKSKTKAEIVMLVSAVNQFKDRFGSYPEQQSTKALNFVNDLSKVKTNVGWSGKRPMYIDFERSDFLVGVPGTGKYYDIVMEGHDASNPTVTKYALDSYRLPYMYVTNEHPHTVDCPSGCKEVQDFLIYSAGLDGLSDDPTDKDSYNAGTDDNEDNVTSNDL